MHKLQKTVILFCLAAISLNTVQPTHAGSTRSSVKKADRRRRERKHTDRKNATTAALVGLTTIILGGGITLYKYKGKKNNNSSNPNEDQESPPPTEKEILAVADNTKIYLIDVEKGSKKILENETRGCDKLSFSPNGTILAVQSDSGSVLLFDVRTNNKIGEESYGKNIVNLAWKPNSKKEELALIDIEGKIRCLEIDNKNNVKEIKEKSISYSLLKNEKNLQILSISPNQRYIAYYKEEKVYVRDTTTEQSDELLSGAREFNKVMFSPDGNFCACCKEGRNLIIFQIQANESGKKSNFKQIFTTENLKGEDLKKEELKKKELNEEELKKKDLKKEELKKKELNEEELDEEELKKKEPLESIWNIEWHKGSKALAIEGELKSNDYCLFLINLDNGEFRVKKTVYGYYMYNFTCSRKNDKLFVHNLKDVTEMTLLDKEYSIRKIANMKVDCMSSSLVALDTKDWEKIKSKKS